MKHCIAGTLPASAHECNLTCHLKIHRMVMEGGGEYWYNRAMDDPLEYQSGADTRNTMIQKFKMDLDVVRFTSCGVGRPAFWWTDNLTHANRDKNAGPERQCYQRKDVRQKAFGY
jgi:hypothetical protein